MSMPFTAKGTVPFIVEDYSVQVTKGNRGKAQIE
jgi:hypothetical protein